MWVAVWLLGTMALGVGLWPSRYRPWLLPRGWEFSTVPGTHHVEHLPILDNGNPPQRMPAFGGRPERWDLDAGKLVSVGPELPAYRYDWRYGSSGLNARVVRPADESDETPLRLIEWPSGRELGRHPAPAHLFAVGEPEDGLYAVGLPAEEARNSWLITPADLADPWQVHIQEVGTGRRLRSRAGAGLRDPVTRGRLLVTVEPRELVPDGTSQTVSVWDVTDGRRVCTVPLGPSTPSRRHEFHLPGNGRYLLDTTGQVWEVATGAVVRSAHPGPMMWTVLSKDGRWLLQLDYDRNMIWFDTEAGVTRTDRGRLPVPGYGNAGGSSYSVGPWGDGQMFVTRAHQRPPSRVQRWLTDKLPFLFQPATGYDWYDFRIVDPATGQAAMSTPMFVTQGTDDGELLFLDGPDGQRRLYFTGRLIPWAAASAAVGWTLLVVAVYRRRRRPATSR